MTIQSSQPDVIAQSVQFAPLDPPTPNTPHAEAAPLDLLMDVPLRVSVELGRTRLPVKEILSLQQGSLVELDRLAGEPVDVLVNDHLIAHGEVVVIEDKFGIRITETISPSKQQVRE